MLNNYRTSCCTQSYSVCAYPFGQPNLYVSLSSPQVLLVGKLAHRSKDHPNTREGLMQIQATPAQSTSQAKLRLIHPSPNYFKGMLHRTLFFVSGSCAVCHPYFQYHRKPVCHPYYQYPYKAVCHPYCQYHPIHARKACTYLILRVWLLCCLPSLLPVPPDPRPQGMRSKLGLPGSLLWLTTLAVL